MMANIFLALALIASFVYMFLGLLAYQYRCKEGDIDTGWVLSPLWALFPSAYDRFGQSLCAKGKILFWMAMVLTIIWILLDYLAV